MLGAAFSYLWGALEQCCGERHGQEWHVFCGGCVLSVRSFKSTEGQGSKAGALRDSGLGAQLVNTVWRDAQYFCSQCTGLNINISITDPVVFNSTYVKKLNKVNRSCFQQRVVFFFFLWETAVWPRGRDLSYNWNFLASFYCTLKFKQPFALGSFSLPHPRAQAVSDPGKRFINIWGKISYLCRTATRRGLLLLFTKK